MSESYKDHLEKQMNNLIDPMSFDKDSPYAKKDTNKPVQPMVFDVPTKSFEDKIYIILLVGENNDSMFDGNFKICNGRTECYRHIQSLIEAFGDDIDVHESKIITETKQTETETGNSKYYMINIMESLSIYAFCKSVEGYYSNDTFAIDQYFDPPNDNIKSTEVSNDDAFAYIASIEDDIVAQAAADTFREREAELRKFLNNTNMTIPNIGMAPNINPKREFPMLFDDNDGSINV